MRPVPDAVPQGQLRLPPERPRLHRPRRPDALRARECHHPGHHPGSRPGRAHLCLPHRAHTRHHGQPGPVHVPLHRAVGRDVLRVAHRRGRRTAALHRPIRQYAEARAGAVQLVRTETAAHRTDLPPVRHLQPQARQPPRHREPQGRDLHPPRCPHRTAA